MDYPTLQGKLIMPEYGRNIQQMVKHAMNIEDREERTRCVQTIINIMGSLFPYLRDVNDFKHKLWDHLAIMSDFKLDIDYPYELVQPEKLASKPEKVPYSTGSIKVRHYGRYLEELLDKAMAMEEGPERTRLIELMANHMKKSIFSLNREIVEDQKIYDDLKLLSGGKVQVNEETVKLIDVKELNPRKSMPRQNQGGNRKNQK